MTPSIFTEINNSRFKADLFELMTGYFNGQGFGGVCYIAPDSVAGPYSLTDSGMPTEWMARYREQMRHCHDPIPGMAFRQGHPVRFDDLLKNLPSLTKCEHSFIEEYRASGLTDGLAIPTFGPYGRPGFIGLARIAHPRLLEQIDTSLAAAVAQQFHTRMELLQTEVPIPGLSPREREILSWLVKGKSNADIATIIGSACPTVATHIQRIYGKLHVNDRVNCTAKALARHYI